MYAIRSYYVRRHDCRDSPDRRVVLGAGNFFAGRDFVLNRSEVLVDARITSYNVCYTKLLRDRRKKQPFAWRSFPLAEGPSGNPKCLP